MELGSPVVLKWNQGISDMRKVIFSGSGACSDKQRAQNGLFPEAGISMNSNRCTVVGFCHSAFPFKWPRFDPCLYPSQMCAQPW